VKIYTFNVTATFDNIQGDSDRLLIPKLLVTVHCECIDSLLDDFSLTLDPLTVEIRTKTTQINLPIPKDSSSKVQSNQDGYTYCGARRLYASIDGNAFVVDTNSNTFQFNETTGNLTIYPV